MKKGFLHIVLLILLAILALSPLVSAQVKVQVVTLKRSESYRWKPGQNLEINGERAEIYVSAHESEFIEIEIQLIAKHADKAVAEKDLKKLQVMIEKMRSTIFIRDFIELDKNNQKPSSGLKTVMHIKVPANCPVKINNYFGKIDVKNLTAKVNIISDYSKVELLAIDGIVSVQSKFGDITAEKTKGQLTIVSNRSDVVLRDVSGLIHLKCTLAEVRIFGLINPDNLKIDAKRSNIIISSDNSVDFGYNLTLEKVEFEKPGWLYLDYEQKQYPLIIANTIDFEKVPVIEIKLNTGSLDLINSAGDY